MSRKRDRTQPVNWAAPEDVGVDKMTLLQIERDTALADAKYDRKTAQDLRAEIDGLERECDALREALIVAREDLVHWAGYASDYFKNKHDYVGDLAVIDAALRNERDVLRAALIVTDAMVDRALDAWNDAAIYSTIELKLRHVLCAALEVNP